MLIRVISGAKNKRKCPSMGNGRFKAGEVLCSLNLCLSDPSGVGAPHAMRLKKMEVQGYLEVQLCTLHSDLFVRIKSGRPLAEITTVQK